jgi:two-component system response regulator FixJ
LQFACDSRKFAVRIFRMRVEGGWRMTEQQVRGPDIKTAEPLTPREREVLGRIIAGASNKEAGRTLGISPRTVEVHRARIMAKLRAKNAADLVRIALGQGPSH